MRRIERPPGSAPVLTMRFLKESLLSFLVVGVVLCLYFVAAVAALFTECDFRTAQIRTKYPASF
jgi:hypothetical protein